MHAKPWGVILPGRPAFNTRAPETMEINGGVCRVKPTGSAKWETFRAGDRFSVPGDSSFEIEVLELLDYVCHFG